MVLKEQWDFMKTVKMKLNFTTQNSFKKNKITKSNYINEMHNYHKILTIYPSLIENTEVKNIIDDKGLICLNNDWIELDEFDKRYIPIEIINLVCLKKMKDHFLTLFLKVESDL